MEEKGKRLNVGKLKSKYYDGEADYTTDFTLSDVQKDLTATLNEEALAKVEDNRYEEVEAKINDFIRSTRYANYNDISKKGANKISASELVTFFMQIYNRFSSQCPLAFLIIVFGDYFALDYLTLIRSLPNYLQETLYHDTFSCTRDKSLLNQFFSNDVDMMTPHKLF